MHFENLNPSVTLSVSNLDKMAIAISELELLLKQSLGKNLRAAPQNAWLRFSKMKEDQQQQAIRGLEEQKRFLQGALNEGIEGFDEASMLKYALEKLFLIGEGDLTQDIRSGDVVEIFDEELRQIYRSFSCFSLSNYSLLELSTLPWFELYERTQSIEGRLIDSCQHIIQGKSPYLDMTDKVPTYTIREILTEERAIFSMKERFMRRLTGTNSKKHFCLSVKEVKEIASETSNQSIHFLRGKR